MKAFLPLNHPHKSPKTPKNDILFLNWQKIVSRSAETRVLRRPENEEERKEAGYYFEDLVDNTHAAGRDIILVVDEAHTHTHTELAQEMIDCINPRIIVHVSATPTSEPSASDVRNNRAGLVEVLREAVVEQGLIKDYVALPDYEDLLRHKGQDLDEVLLALGIEKRASLKKEFDAIGKGKDVNPLMLIQLPNDDRRLIEMGQRTKESIVLSFLKARGVDDSAVALWFDNKKKNLEHITDNDSDIDYMLFKQAAGTGWDCPRAHVLVMFREIELIFPRFSGHRERIVYHGIGGTLGKERTQSLYS